MITTIVDAMDITSRKKILDPACGGGNFLLYSIDSFCNQTTFPQNDKAQSLPSRYIGRSLWLRN